MIPEVLAAWRTGIPFGVLLVGDALSRERLWALFVSESDVRAGPGTDPAAAMETTDPWTGVGRAGILRGTLALSSAHLLDPVQAAVLARAPRILAQAPALADVPAALASRLTVVVELPYRPGERPATDIVPTTSAPVEPADTQDIVDLLTRFGLAGHLLDLGAARFAEALARVGRTDALDLVESLVCRPRAGASTPPPSQPPADKPDQRGQDESRQQAGNPDQQRDQGEDQSQQRDQGEDQSQRRDNGDDRGQEQDDGEEQPAQPPDAAPPMPPARHHLTRRPSRVRLNGRHGAPLDGAARGRRRRVVPVSAAGGVPDLLATLTAALPWHRQRRSDGQTRVVILPEDLRGRLRRRPGGRVLIVIVDASGSMAQRMIRTAKGIALAAGRHQRGRGCGRP